MSCSIAVIKHVWNSSPSIVDRVIGFIVRFIIIVIIISLFRKHIMVSIMVRSGLWNSLIFLDSDIGKGTLYSCDILQHALYCLWSLE